VWAGHPLGRPILGRWDVVREFERAAILSHFEEEYAPGRIVVAAAGHLDHAQVMDLFATRFNGFRRQVVDREMAPPTMHAGVHVVSKPLEQVHLVAGFPGIAENAPERYAFYLLNDVLGVACPPGCSGDPRASGARLFRHSGPSRIETRASSTSTPAPTRRTSPRS
jgi:predicted Zn-dependent peptidase